MKQLLAIGEALIDFIPGESEKALKEVGSFALAVGGAPANVCGAFARLGGATEIITQLGADPFGDKIVDEFRQYGIGVSHVLRTQKANTSLAFVALKADGNREFSFYRKPGADMLFDPANVKPEWFSDAFALHFCSVSLGNFPMKEAHVKAIACAQEAGALISFDPNIRFPLWDDHQKLYDAIWEFLPQAHILKISDEELAFITGCNTIEAALPKLFTGNVRLVIYTQAAARAIVTKPSLILADEPTGALDSRSAQLLLESFRLLNEKIHATILMVAHDAFAASYCRRILFLRDGKIFNELVRGNESRKQFFDRIVEVIALLGGELDVE